MPLLLPLSSTLFTSMSSPQRLPSAAPFSVSGRYLSPSGDLPWFIVSRSFYLLSVICFLLSGSPLSCHVSPILLGSGTITWDKWAPNKSVLNEWITPHSYFLPCMSSLNSPCHSQTSMLICSYGMTYRQSHSGGGVWSEDIWRPLFYEWYDLNSFPRGLWSWVNPFSSQQAQRKAKEMLCEIIWKSELFYFAYPLSSSMF